MNRDEAVRYANEWIRHWCDRNVDAIVSHFAEDARFVSPVAAKCTGNSLVIGRHALSRYWAVVHSFTTFRFTLDRIIWDDAAQELAIIYSREIDGRHDRACEILRFNPAGQVAAGEAFYGVDLVGESS